MLKKLTLSVIFVISVTAGQLFAQPGNLDLTFSSDGKVTTDFGSEIDMGQAMLIQPDGKIVIAGFSWSGSNCLFALLRYDTTGNLDNTFGTGGKVTTDINTGNDQANAIAIQTDGKLIAAGLSHNGTNNDFALVRYNTNGTLDTSFSHDGIVTTAMGSGIDVIYGLAIDANGNIVAAGEAKGSSNTDFAVARYTPSGSLDTSFNHTGKLTTAVGTSSDRAYAVALQTDNKIVVAGSTVNVANTNFALVRYNENGTLDNTFDSDGILMTSVVSTDDNAYALVIQPDGKILAAGQAKPGSNYDFAIVRYNSNGSLDNTFSTDGMVTTPIGTADDYIYSIVLQPDGKIVAAGYSYTSTSNQIALARYDSYGTLDNTFSSDGKVTTAIGSASGAKAVALQSNGKIVVAGYSGSGANSMFAAARYIVAPDNGINDDCRNINAMIIYPNPVDQNAVLKYTLISADVVSIALTDIQGRRLMTYADNQKQQAGEHEALINIPADLSKGVYSLVITTTGGKRGLQIIR